MTYSRRKSVVLSNNTNPRVYRTFEDWQAEQRLDVRTPEQRGITVGSLVTWRHMHNRIIITDRATVLSISGDTLMLLVKDVSDRTCNAEVCEIVNSRDNRPSLSLYEMNRNSYLSSQSVTENLVQLLPGTDSTPYT